MESGNSQFFVGIDIGGTKIQVVIADRHGAIHGEARKKHKGAVDFEWVVGRSVAAVDAALDKAKLGRKEISALGIGAPSPILPDGTAVHAPNLGWQNVPLVATFAQELGWPTYAANDCDAGTFGEHRFGAGQAAQTVVGLFMGTGIGGGLVRNGEILAGDNYQGAEFGHTKVQVGGQRCGCGARGCLEAYASKLGIASFVAHQVNCEGRETMLTELCDGDYRSLRSSALAKAYRATDAVAVAAIDQAADYLGIGVANAITLLAPSVIVLGGGVIEALGSLLLDRVVSAAEQASWPPGSFADTSIRLAKLGDHAVALGAAAWAIQRGQF